MSNISLIMSTSPVPSNPSTAMIESSIAKIRAYPALADCEIIIMCDGVRAEQEHRRPAYEAFKNNLGVLGLKNCSLLIFNEYTNQANMARKALDLVKTPLVGFFEHDFWPVGKIDFDGIFNVLQTQDEVKIIRLYASYLVHESNLMMYPNGLEQFEICGVPLIKTIQWSQNPHIMRTSFYRWIIKEFFGVKATAMIEHVMHSVVANQCGHLGVPWNKFGIALYAPPGLQSSEYCDGRGGDTVYDSFLAYDGPLPAGAPAATKI